MVFLSKGRQTNKSRKKVLLKAHSCILIATLPGRLRTQYISRTVCIVWVMQILVSIGVNFQSRAWQQRSSQGSSFTDVVLENIETWKALHFNCDNYLFQFSFPMEPFNTMMHIHKGNFISCFGWFASKYHCWLVVNRSWSYMLLKVCWLNAESLDNKVRVSFAKMWTNWAGAGARATVNLFFLKDPKPNPKTAFFRKEIGLTLTLRFTYNP